MPGEHDAQAMKRALGELVRRHDILRAAFSQADGDCMQVVSAEVDVALQEVDRQLARGRRAWLANGPGWCGRRDGDRSISPARPCFARP